MIEFNLFQKYLYPKILVAQNCIKNDIEIRFFTYESFRDCSALVQSNIWHKNCL